ncbi:multidrug resistance protein YkkD [Brevibacillus reuszeri]|uniref:Multidrug resistance protein SMR n=1 Tax=Brevibacillus reuszeri TaxID=54915 RepID=A0A0K9Z0Z9_9BACL|nr:multidrug efflux SMR transporter [Brevibacillus reuszeri]KNB74532.1 multidrug resistance protein SMR [Brevibacillus reuszeri]MED1856463.1 multidrug efflux SMR transporter [Brevibacillus reuszeri]GED67839.1 multidrug resistance protein YkkD [Brevibacillus reuszeri]
MTWVSLIVAGLFEVVGVMGITQVNRKVSVRSLCVLIGGFTLSFILLSYAMTEIAMGTAYAVWTGIGTVGSALVGMLFYGEPKDKLRILCIALVIISVAGLKLIA